MRPPNYMMAITIGALLVGIGGLLYVKRKSIEVIYNKDYWAILAVVSFRAMPYSRLKLMRNGR